MKKNLLSLGLAALLSLSLLSACGSSTSKDQVPASEAAATEAAATEAAETEAAETEAAETEAEATEAKKIDKIVFATNPEFPPFEFVSANGVLGEFDGIDMAIAKNIGDFLGCDIEMQSMEFDSLLIALQNGQIDATIAGMTMTEERALSVDFSDPYYTATQVMIVKEGSDISCAADMEGKRIAVVQGYTGETCVSEMGYDYEAFKKGTECVMELMNDKCDVVVIDSATAQKYVADNKGLVIIEDNSAFASEQYAIAVQKGNEELLNAINEAINSMLADGSISELSAKYIDQD